MTIDRATFVPGHPRPKGSLDPQIVRGGGGRPTGAVRMVESSVDGPRWRRTIAKHVLALGWPAIEGPCEVDMTFWFDPASVGHVLDPLDLDDYPTHAHIGDIDKLVRNVLDALGVDKTGKGNGAGVYADDRQVVRVLADKVWAHTDRGGIAGVGLRVVSLGRADL